MWQITIQPMRQDETPPIRLENLDDKNRGIRVNIRTLKPSGGCRMHFHDETGAGLAEEIKNRYPAATEEFDTALECWHAALDICREEMRHHSFGNLRELAQEADLSSKGRTREVVRVEDPPRRSADADSEA
jgi:hypothetical protein